MKKIVSLLLVVLAFTVCACSQDRVVKYSDLPENAKKIISEYFSVEGISSISIDREKGVDSEYEVRYDDGIEIDFSMKGELIKVDCNRKQVPAGILPEKVLTYVQNNYPSSFVTEWEKSDKKTWKAELNSGIELKFNSNYQIIGTDKD